MNNLSVVEQYNRLYESIRKAKTDVDVRTIFGTVKEFANIYKDVDATSVKQICDKFLIKVRELVEENDTVYEHLNTKVESIRNRAYDYKGENDVTVAVQNKVLQLMAQLPKVKTSANSGMIANTIAESIRSGEVGSKAVLELLKYPAYADMVSVRQRDEALIGCKSEAERKFDKSKAYDLQKAEKALTDVYLQSYHLRNIEKQFIVFNKNI